MTTMFNLSMLKLLVKTFYIYVFTVVLLSVSGLASSSAFAYSQNRIVKFCQSAMLSNITSSGIGKLKIGMRLDDLLSTCKKSQIRKEMDSESEEITVLVPDQQYKIRAIIFDGQVYRIEVSDQRFFMASGIHVGSTISSELLKKFNILNGEGVVVLAPKNSCGFSYLVDLPWPFDGQAPDEVKVKMINIFGCGGPK